MKRKIESKNQQLERIDIYKDQAYEHYCNGIIEEEMFMRKSSEFKLRKEEVEKEIATLMLQSDDSFLQTADSILELAKDMKLLWLSRNKEERVELLRKILWNPTITKGTIGFHLKKPFKVLSDMKEFEGKEKWGGQGDNLGELVTSKLCLLNWLKRSKSSAR